MVETYLNINLEREILEPLLIDHTQVCLNIENIQRPEHAVFADELIES
jgi:hypothetical protein